MTDWLIHLLIQIGGTAALLAVAGVVIGKWLWKKINAALESYTTAYAQEAARIDARIGHLEKLAEEQARLTRAVETIKDEIAGQRKMHDNRWAFRKDVYVNILTACDALANSLVAIQTMQRTINSRTPGYESLLALQQQNTRDMVQAQKEFSKHAFLAPLALADEMAPLVQIAWKELTGPDLDSSDSDADLTTKLQTLLRLMAALQAAGRKELWGDSEPDRKAEAARPSPTQPRHPERQHHPKQKSSPETGSDWIE